MNLKIDKAGRVILPKPVRDRHGIKAGADLEFEETPDGVILKNINQRPALVKMGNFLVYTGEVPRDFDIVKAIADERETRIRKLAWL